MHGAIAKARVHGLTGLRFHVAWRMPHAAHNCCHCRGGAIAKSDMDGKTCMIGALNPYNNRWVIQVHLPFPPLP